MKAEDFVGWVSPDGKLKVVGIIRKTKGGISIFKVTCTECSKDKELFPDGYFTSSKGHLISGCKPCGCSKSRKWSLEEYLVLLNRVGKRKGFVIVGPSEKYKGAHTKIKLKCLKDMCEWYSEIAHILNTGSGCPACGKLSAKRKQSHSEDFAKSKCESICKEMKYTFINFPEGYENCYSKLNYTCPNHGNQTVSYESFVYTGSRCPSCAETGYNPNKPGSFYIVKWTKDDHSFIKFGITNKNVLDRIKQQARKTEYLYEILFHRTWKDGKIAYNIEKSIKTSKAFSINVIDKEYFNDGFTETVEINNINRLLDCVHSYLRKIVLDEVIEYVKPEETE